MPTPTPASNQSPGDRPGVRVPVAVRWGSAVVLVAAGSLAAVLGGPIRTMVVGSLSDGVQVAAYVTRRRYDPLLSTLEGNVYTVELTNRTGRPGTFDFQFVRDGKPLTWSTDRRFGSWFEWTENVRLGSVGEPNVDSPGHVIEVTTNQPLGNGRAIEIIIVNLPITQTMELPERADRIAVLEGPPSQERPLGWAPVNQTVLQTPFGTSQRQPARAQRGPQLRFDPRGNRRAVEVPPVFPRKNASVLA